MLDEEDREHLTAWMRSQEAINREFQEQIGKLAELGSRLARAVREVDQRLMNHQNHEDHDEK